ncbi:hypothetical protein JTB14_027814 [Gonioctena quinquepunctata]|nr:hypothetical protein JTB14_027814 [Gonioctena quinquepunctata]
MLGCVLCFVVLESFVRGSMARPVFRGGWVVGRERYLVPGKESCGGAGGGNGMSAISSGGGGGGRAIRERGKEFGGTRKLVVSAPLLVVRLKI